MLGVLAYQVGDAAAAGDHFQGIVRTRPGDADYRSCLGAAYQDLAQMDEPAACDR